MKKKCNYLLQAFQFNSKYLLTIHDHLYSCQYGTFVGEYLSAPPPDEVNIRVNVYSGNCQREREELKLSEKTFSLWGFLTNNADEFLNPLYDYASKVRLTR